MKPLDPWGSGIIEEEKYRRLIKEFGISPLDELKHEIENPDIYVRRGIDFGHRDLDKWLKDARKGNAAVLTGIKPSGRFHLGNLITAQKLIHYQKTYNVTAFYTVADFEAFIDNHVPFEACIKYARDNVADLIALGLDVDRAYIYLQSQNTKVMKLCFLAASKVTNNMLKAVYGERSIGLYMCALVQVGDILLPQDEEFGGAKSVLVPVGIDQDPHIRLTRDIARKYDLIPPAAIYHKLLRGLGGKEKMSKRNPMSYITLSDDERTLRKKIFAAFTGGKGTSEQQRREGGNPEICSVFELAKFFFVKDDGELKEIYDRCREGKILCGECKNLIYQYAAAFLKEHRSKKSEAMKIAKRLVKPRV